MNISEGLDPPTFDRCQATYLDESVYYTHLHECVDHLAKSGANFDKKQLRFNDIVRVAKVFYPKDVAGGITELVCSCDKTDPLYVPKQPMWKTLEDAYGWMIK